VREAIAGFAELLRRLGRATADGAAGFLFTEDMPMRPEEQEEDHSQKTLDMPANSGEVNDLEQVPDSPLDAICQDLTESMDSLGASQDHQGGEGLTLEPEISSHEQGVHHSQ
jgi:hypothetical protein